MKKKIIGIVGGVGPAAGIDLAARIVANTAVSKDQEHIPFILTSLPELIPDRTEYLLGKEDKNPAYGIFDSIQLLKKSGATVIGIACNTAHAPQIFDKVIQLLNEAKIKVKLLHIINEVYFYLKNEHPNIPRIGILTTRGSYKTGLFTNPLIGSSITPLIPDEEKQNLIHNAIYNEEYGIKAVSNPVTKKARDTLINEIKSFRRQGAEAVILGCTEMPLAIPEKECEGILLINPAEVLARRLIAEVDETKLVPL